MAGAPGPPHYEGVQLSSDPPALQRPVIFEQLWCDLAFLHWPVDPVEIEPYFPPGSRPDTYGGVSYVGLVPFRMRRAGLFRNRPIPYLGDFLEVNVRLYSVDGAGRHGVVFRSLDCDRLPVVAAARVLGVPYVHARIAAADYPPVRGYEIAELPSDRRRWWTVQRRGGPGTQVELRVGDPVEPTELEVFLTARWGMHSSLAGRGLWTPNEHSAWTLRAAELTGLQDELVAAAGIRPVGPMLRPLWSRGVRARFGLPHSVRRRVSVPTPAWPVR